LVNTWLLHAFPIAKLGTMTDFQRTEMSYSNNDFQLVVDSKLILNCEGACTFPNGLSKFIVASHSEGKNKAESDSHGGRQQFPIFNISPLQMLTFEGAQAAPNHSHQLIVEYKYSKICLHFCKDCRIFCEGVKDDDNAVSQQLFVIGKTGFVGFDGQIGYVGYNGLVGRNNHINHIGLINHKRLTSIAGFVSVVSRNSIISLINLAALLNHWLIGLISVIGFGHISLVGLRGFSLFGLSGINSLIEQISLVGFVGLVSLSGFGLISLVGISGFGLVLGIISFVDVSGFGLVGLNSLVAAIISAAVLATHTEATKLTSATKIASKAILYYFDASLHHVYVLVRVEMWWWLALPGKRCGGGLPLLATPSTCTTMTHYNMQNNYFLSEFR
jgi:hypothetical protein